MTIDPRRALPLASLFILGARGTAVAQAHEHGPQAGAYGKVHFATSCKPATTTTFDHAVAALHSFEFGEAIAGFESVLTADSTCAMAHWGIALSRWSNPMGAALRGAGPLTAGRAAVELATRLQGRATDRERGYIAAVGRLYEDYEHVPQTTRVASYARAMSDLTTKFPADTEAKIFAAIATVAAASPSDKTFRDQRRAGATLESLWVKQPEHPGLAHYIIHAYDAPPLAALAARAAARYAVIAPSAPHALHMPSHTFTRRGEWDASIATNARSIDVAKRVGGFGEALHASDYTIYALLQQARDAEAAAVVDSAQAIASRLSMTAVVGAAPPEAGVFALAAIPTRYALERRDWRRATTLVSPKNAELFPWTAAIIHFARALGAAHTGDVGSARIAVDSLTAIAHALQSANAYWAEQVNIQRLAATAAVLAAEHRTDSAVAVLREAARHEDATEKNAVTPGPFYPAHEQLGDLLLELERNKEALAEYRATLAKEPNRFRALYGAMRAAAGAGDKTAVARYRAQLTALTAKAMNTERPELRELRGKSHN